VHILIAGGSGFLGSYLIKKCSSHGDQITLLTRNPTKIDAQPSMKVVYWDGKTVKLPPLEKPVDVVINLCGLSIARRWSAQAKKQIHNSRIEPSKALVKWCLEVEKSPKTFIQISGIDYYDMTTMACKENDPAGSTFLARLAKDWEATTKPLDKSNTRLVIARLAPVLAKTHPPLQPILLSTQYFLGAMIGPGSQYFSWIHHEDFTTIIIKMIKEKSISGTYNVCSPYPIPYATFIKTLATICHRPAWLTMPSWLMKTLLGEMASLVLDSRKVLPEKLMAAEHKFKYPEIQQALTQIVKPECTKNSTNNHS
jgi:uncharacterized protein (TIGR01777 family)